MKELHEASVSFSYQNIMVTKLNFYVCCVSIFYFYLHKKINMKKLNFLVLVIIISTMTAKSQGGFGGMGGGGMGGGMRGNRNSQPGNENRKEAEPISNDQKAQNMVQKINDKIPATRSKKDSLIIAYKNFYDELEMYRTEGNKEVIKIIAQKRDNKIKQILSNDEVFADYQKFLDEMRAQRQQQKQNGGEQNGSYGRPGGNSGLKTPGF